MKNIIMILFAVMCLAQWIVPGKMVYDSENTISLGTVFKFKTEPVDPSDPFRGKYVTLRFESDFIEIEDSAEWVSGDDIFVTFTTDIAGFAKAENIFRVAPDAESFLQTTVSYIHKSESGYQIVFKLPFDRFYLEESKAPRAEELYREAQRDSATVAFALVSIGQGEAVLQDVIVNDRPIVDIINDENAIAP
jgi:uncharacterized membrane-anchored protein